MKRIPAARRVAITLVCVSVLGLVFGLSQPAGAVPAPAPSDSNSLYLPLVENLSPVYLPLLLYQQTVPINLANGSFEADTTINLGDSPPCHYFGFTDQPKGNQHPSGWT